MIAPHFSSLCVAPWCVGILCQPGLPSVPIMFVLHVYFFHPCAIFANVKLAIHSFLKPGQARALPDLEVADGT